MITTHRPVRRTGVAARAAGSALLLGVLLIGPPLALMRFVGWPLPRTMPSWAGIADALSGASVSDAVVIDVLACAAWALWALLLVCAIAEASAWARCRDARRLAVAGFLQPAVRELVAAVALLLTALRPTVPATASTPPPRMVSFVAPSPPEAMPTAPAGPSCVVAPRDSLWKLAERHLGDGMRWREIWDLNRSASFPDGRRFSDPDLILPGWVLAMPADAVGLPAQRPDVSESEEAPPPAPARQALPAPDPPSTTAPSPRRAPPVAASTTTQPDAAGGSTTSVNGATDRDDPDHDVRPLLAASTLVAAGVVAVLARLRRRQLRHRPPCKAIRLPEGEAADTEVHLRRAAADAPFDRLDLAMRALAHVLAGRRGGPSPSISVLSAGPDAIEILLAEPVDAPAGPFEVSAAGRAWTLPSSVADDELRPLAEARSGPAPGLVAVGAIDERTVLIDLEAGSRTLIGGDPDDATALLWSMAVDLATSNRADDIDLVLVGNPPAGLEALDRVRVAGSVDDVLRSVEAGAAATTKQLAHLRRSSTFDARISDPSLILTPTVVLVAGSADGLDVERLLTLAGEAHGVAVVVAVDDVDGEFDRELCVEADTLVVKPVGLRLRPAALPQEVVEHVGELVATAIDLDGDEEMDDELAPACRPVTDGLTIGPHDLPLTFDNDGEPGVPPGHVLVRVMGPVEIVGSERPIDRRRSVELVVYLAFHPEGADEARIREALWPEGEPTRAAFNETVSKARRMLGLDPTGEHHLRPADNRRYRLGPYVTTDAEVMLRSTDRHARERLARGVPFEGTAKGYEWAYREGHAYRIMALLDRQQQSAPSAAAVPT